MHRSVWRSGAVLAGPAPPQPGMRGFGPGSPALLYPTLLHCGSRTLVACFSFLSSLHECFRLNVDYPLFSDWFARMTRMLLPAHFAAGCPVHCLSLPSLVVEGGADAASGCVALVGEALR